MSRSSLLGKPLSNKHQHLIGAGIAGLLLGFFLKQKGIPFTIYEKSDRAGGMLGSIQGEHGLYERAANGFLWTQAMQEVSDTLGLTLLAPSKAASARYLLRDGKMKRMPLNFFELMGAIGRMMVPRKVECKTIYDFGKTYFGETLTRQLLEPAFAGIYGGQTSELSFSATMGKLAEAQASSRWLPAGLFAMLRKRKRASEQTAPTSAKPVRGTHCFAGGTQELIDALAKHLQDHIQYDTDGQSAFPVKAGSAATIDTSSPMNADVIHCTPAYTTAKYFKDTALAPLLSTADYFPMISIGLVIEKKQLPRFKKGFGLLIPRSEGITALGVLFNHCIFADRVNDSGVLNLTCIYRDDSGELSKAGDAELMQTVYADLAKLFAANLSVAEGETPALEALEYRVNRWEKGIPAYNPKLQRAWDLIDQELSKNFPAHRIFGNYSGQVSIRGMAEQAQSITEAI